MIALRELLTMCVENIIRTLHIPYHICIYVYLLNLDIICSFIYVGYLDYFSIFLVMVTKRPYRRISRQMLFRIFTVILLR